LLDSRPWLPVMGEFHYSRCPEAEWREELLKMKAGGIDIVATYVFWIHHEEAEGSFDWSGRRSLRGFVELCREVGLSAVVRCGPWCHGEVRNGGLPDWILRKGFKVRSDDPAYLVYVRRLYGDIAGQLRGLLWKEGGPVVGVQFENEYRGPAEHLLTLKRTGREAGLDVPIYTRTGWPDLTTRMPLGEMLPLFGAYAEGFWDRVLTPMPGKYPDAFLFKLARTDAAIATDQLGQRKAQDGDDVGSYPYFCCEIGGGMVTSYHRRIRIAPEDVEATSLVKLGSGNNLQGYYMYHGGTNPEGKLSTLHESQATNYPNDLPVKSYEFQSPLGEFGQLNRHYHTLRRAHLFLRDYGAALAASPARLPEVTPADAKDTSTLRWSARTDGRSGFVFVSNYQRLQPMPRKEGVQFQLKLRDGELRVPEEPFDVPADSLFFWPFNLDAGLARLVYATAQPVCRVEDRGATYLVFAQTAGLPSEFVFEGKGVTLKSTTGQATRDVGRLRVRHVKPGTGAAVFLNNSRGGRLYVILLDEGQSRACWKGTLAGRERIFLTRAGLVLDGDRLRLTAEDPSDLTVALLPAPRRLAAGGSKLVGRRDGLFQRFNAQRPRAAAVSAAVKQVQSAGPAREVRKGKAGVAEAPSDADFDSAAVWRVKLPAGVDARRDLLLRFAYVGDAARLYLGGRLLTDNFYNGNAFEVGLRRYAPDAYRKELLLKILPLRKGAPIHLAADAWPDFGAADSAVRLERVEVIERRVAELVAG
jgi:beta-galactosidase